MIHPYAGVDGPELFWEYGTEIQPLASAVQLDPVIRPWQKSTEPLSNRGDNDKLKGYSSWPKGVNLLGVVVALHLELAAVSECWALQMVLDEGFRINKICPKPATLKTAYYIGR